MQLKLHLVKTNQNLAERISKKANGSDYMNDIIEDKKMIEKKEQIIEAGKSVNLKCSLANGIISKCSYYGKGGYLMYRSEPGVFFEDGRIKCLCDVSRFHI